MEDKKEILYKEWLSLW